MNIEEINFAAAGLFRWLFGAAGFWLTLSPFILFSPEALSSGASDRETLFFMSAGLLVLIITGFGDRIQVLLQLVPVVLLGGAMIWAPWVFGFAGHTAAALNACILGVALIALAIADVFVTQSQFRHKLVDS